MGANPHQPPGKSNLGWPLRCGINAWSCSTQYILPSPFIIQTVSFLANVNVLRYVCYMRSQFRLSSVCLSSVTLVHPTQAVELFGNFFSPYDSPGTLLFCCQKSSVGDAPFPLKFAFKVTHPLSNSEISTNIGS